MELRPPGTPLDDPFFDAVRRRHPDVDLVVLPRRRARAGLPGRRRHGRRDRRRRWCAEAAADSGSPRSRRTPTPRPTTADCAADRRHDVRAVARVVDHRATGRRPGRAAPRARAARLVVQRPPGGLERLVGEPRRRRRCRRRTPSGRRSSCVSCLGARSPVGAERARSWCGADAGRAGLGGRGLAPLGRRSTSTCSRRGRADRRRADAAASPRRWPAPPPGSLGRLGAARRPPAPSARPGPTALRDRRSGDFLRHRRARRSRTSWRCGGYRRGAAMTTVTLPPAAAPRSRR